MNAWQVLTLSVVAVSFFGYAALAGVILKRKNGVMWSALQVIVASDVARTGLWGWRTWLRPELYREPQAEMMGIFAAQLVGAIATWVLALRMRGSDWTEGGP